MPFTLKSGSLSARTTLSLILGLLAAMVIIVIGTNLVSAAYHAEALSQAGDGARASRDLFRALAEGRSERGNANGYLLASSAAGSDYADRVLSPRAAGQTAFEHALTELDTRIDGLPAALERLRQAQSNVAALRPQVDAAVRKPAAERDATVAQTWPGMTQTYLDALGAVTDVVDGAIAFSDPTIAYYLSIKRAAWSSRLGNGGYGFRIGAALAAHRGWTPMEAAASREDRGRSLSAWDVMARAAARSDAPTALREAVAKASTNFVGPSFDEDRRIMETLSTGAASEVPLSDLLRRYGADQPLIVEVAVVAADQMVQEARAKLHEAHVEVLRDVGLAVMAVLLAVFGFFAVRRRVTKPLAAMVSSMHRLAARDMTASIPGTGRSDEIGQMADAVAVFRDSMMAEQRLAAAREADQAAKAQRTARVESIVTTFEQEAASLVSVLSMEAEQLQGTANTMTDRAELAGAQAAEVARAAVTASGGVQNVAAAAEQLSASINEISRQVAQSAAVASRAVTDAEQTDQIGRALTQSISRIGDIIKLISNIAGQTNLLALNATIEAVRAGDAGKGFAVVANEVKALATQTAKATADITAQVGQIQTITGSAVGAIDSIARTIGEMNDIAVAIAAAVEEQSTATREIASTVQKTADATSTVTTNIAAVSTAVSETGATGRSMLDAASQLTSSANGLSSKVECLASELRAA